MTMKGPHRIRRQSWTVKAASEKDAFAIQQSLRLHWEDSLLAAFERAFDEVAPGDEVIHLARLELDLSVSSEADFAAERPVLLDRQLGARLRAAIDGVYTPYASRPRTTTPQQEQYETLLGYLRTGVLQWSEADRAFEVVQAELRETCRRELQTLAAIARTERISEGFLFRLFQLVPEPELPAIVEVLLRSTGHDAESGAWIVELVTALGDSRIERLERAAVFVAAMMSSGPVDQAGEPGQDEQDDAEQAGAMQELADLLQSLDDTARMFENIADAPTQDPDSLQAMLEAVPEQYREQLRRLMDLPPAEPNATPAPATGDMPAASQATEGLANDLASALERMIGPARETDVLPAAMHNAGLVLVHSFITPLLINMGIAEPGASRLPVPMRQRAVAALHYLATGREDAYEFELGMARALLGIEPEMPIHISEGLLAEEDRAEVDALLDAVLQHWKVLGNTTRDGLRTSFLSRRGLLRADHDGLRLHVERAAFDVLLGGLPWGISIVKLPWMQRPMHVEWERP